MTNATTNLRKAALLIRSLDAESAAVLLTQLSDAEAKAVRLAIRELGEFDTQEQAEIRDELSVTAGLSCSTERCKNSTAVNKSNPACSATHELADGVELELSTDDGRDSLRKSSLFRGAKHDLDAPFAWLEGGDLPSLAAVLEREHLSTVAVVLSYLPPEQAGELLAALPAGRRATALERLADLGESDRTSLEVIEKGLADWITARKTEQRRRADRLDTVKAILAHSTKEASAAVLTQIADRDRELADRLGGVPSPSPATIHSDLPRSAIAEQAASLTETRVADPQVDGDKRKLPPLVPLPPPEFDFSQLHSLTRNEIGELFRHCEADCMVLALAGASEEVTQHIENQLPRSVAKELRQRIHRLSAIRLSDVTAAQQQVGQIAGRLFGSSQFRAAPDRVAQPVIHA